MNLLFLIIITLFLVLPAVFCLFSGGLLTFIGIAALIIWLYFIYLIIDEYRKCIKGFDDEENP